MSMMSQSLMPSACEVDITGLLGMYILQMASGSPSALLDWNNNYGDNPDKCVLFHCSNVPKSFFKDSKMDYQEIIAGTVGKENTYGTVVGRIAPNKATFCRTTTDDASGIISAYVGQGEFTSDKLDTFGGYGVMKINNLQALLTYICKMGFEHHVAVNLCQKADAIAEAMGNYLGWEVYSPRIGKSWLPYFCQASTTAWATCLWTFMSSMSGSNSVSEANSAMRFAAAIFILRFISVALASRAPLNMPG